MAKCGTDCRHNNDGWCTIYTCSMWTAPSSIPSTDRLAAAFDDYWHAKWPRQTRDVKRLEMSAHYVGCREAFYAGAQAANTAISS